MIFSTIASYWSVQGQCGPGLQTLVMCRPELWPLNMSWCPSKDKGRSRQCSWQQGVLKKSTSWSEKVPKPNRYWYSCACAAIWTSCTEGPTRIELYVAYLSFQTRSVCLAVLKFQIIFPPIFTRLPKVTRQPFPSHKWCHFLWFFF